MDKMEAIEIFIVILVIFLVYFPYLEGIRNFQDLEKSDQAENLRWLSSALIQAHAAVLAIVPTISLTFMSFFGSKYPFRLTKSYWKYFDWPSFLFLMLLSISFCYVVLVSVSGGSETKYNPASYLFLDTLSIVSTFAAVCLVLRRISELTDIEEIFKDLKNEILSSSKKSMIAKRAEFKGEIGEIFSDYFSLMASLAESKNLTGLRAGIVTLFDLVMKNETHMGM